MASGLPPKVEPCVPAVMPLRGLGGGEAGAERKSAAERLGERHDVGGDAGALVGEQLAGAADAGLHLVEDQQQAVLVAELAQRAQELGRHDAHAAFAHDRLDQDRAGRRPDRAPWSPRDRRTASGRSRRPPGRSRRDISSGRRPRASQRAAVEGALEGDDAVALRLAARRLILARHLDRAFHRLGAGIAEEHDVGEARFAQPRGQPLAPRECDRDWRRARASWPARSCAATRCGWAWPSALTATPEVKSR